MGKGQSFQCVGKSYILKNETGLLFYTIYRLTQMDWGLECKTWNSKTSKENIGAKLFDINFSIFFLYGLDFKAKGSKNKRGTNENTLN